MRTRFSPYHAASIASPANPNNIVMTSATTTSVWPRSSLARRIEWHHRGVGHIQQREPRDEKAEWRAAAVRVPHSDARGVRRTRVDSTACGPEIALLDEVEGLSPDDRSSIGEIGPLVHGTRCLRSGCCGLIDPDGAHVGERYLAARAGEDALDGGDDEWIDRRRVGRLARRASERAAAVHERAGDTRPLTSRRRDRHRGVEGG